MFNVLSKISQCLLYLIVSGLEIVGGDLKFGNIFTKMVEFGTHSGHIPQQHTMRVKCFVNRIDPGD